MIKPATFLTFAIGQLESVADLGKPRFPKFWVKEVKLQTEKKPAGRVKQAKTK